MTGPSCWRTTGGGSTWTAERGRGERMLVVMQSDATAEQVAAVCDAIRAMGYQPAEMPGAQRMAVGLIGNDRRVDGAHIGGMAGVAEVINVSSPYKQVSREWR